MQKLAAKLTEKLLRRRLISPEQSEWCAYLVECKLEQLLCFSVLITLGCLIAPLWKVLLLNWGVVFLRRKANGLHLHTFLGCMLSSLCCELAALWTCEKATPAVAALLLILSLLMLRLAAPVNDINIHFDSNEMQALCTGAKTLGCVCRHLQHGVFCAAAGIWRPFCVCLCRCPMCAFCTDGAWNNRDSMMGGTP